MFKLSKREAGIVLTFLVAWVEAPLIFASSGSDDNRLSCSILLTSKMNVLCDVTGNGSLSHNIILLNAGDGRILWRKDVGRCRVWGAVDDGELIYLLCDETLFALQRASGCQLWQFNTKSGTCAGSFDSETLSDPASSVKRPLLGSVGSDGREVQFESPVLSGTNVLVFFRWVAKDEPRYVCDAGYYAFDRSGARICSGLGELIGSAGPTLFLSTEYGRRIRIHREDGDTDVTARVFAGAPRASVISLGDPQFRSGPLCLLRLNANEAILADEEGGQTGRISAESRIGWSVAWVMLQHGVVRFSHRLDPLIEEKKLGQDSLLWIELYTLRGKRIAQSVLQGAGNWLWFSGTTTEDNLMFTQASVDTEEEFKAGGDILIFDPDDLDLLKRFRLVDETLGMPMLPVPVVTESDVLFQVFTPRGAARPMDADASNRLVVRAFDISSRKEVWRQSLP